MTTGIIVRPLVEEELRETLRLTLQEALEFNREEALAAAGAEFREEKIAV